LLQRTATKLLALGFTLLASASQAQLSTSTCNSGSANPPACNAVHGDRTEGWLVQGRSEVMGRNGIVATSQPLAAQAGLDILRHSTSHLLAHAVQELFPGAQVTIGPVIENGFYYDFSYKRPFTPEDLVAIEKRMHELANKNLDVKEKS